MKVWKILYIVRYGHTDKTFVEDATSFVYLTKRTAMKKALEMAQRNFLHNQEYWPDVWKFEKQRFGLRRFKDGWQSVHCVFGGFRTRYTVTYKCVPVFVDR